MRKYEGERYGKGDVAEHLGGHAWVTHTDAGALRTMAGMLNLKTMVDVGCGPGGMVDLAIENGMQAIGIDGDPLLNHDHHPFILHDFTQGVPDGYAPFGTAFASTDPNHKPSPMHDLAWCVEFLEHVDPQFMLNYMTVFEKCLYVLISAAPPGKGGHHHVNCQDQFYWIEKFYDHGFDLDISMTRLVRHTSTMEREFVRENGLVFRNHRFWEKADA